MNKKITYSLAIIIILIFVFLVLNSVLKWDVFKTSEVKNNNQNISQSVNNQAQNQTNTDKKTNQEVATNQEQENEKQEQENVELKQALKVKARTFIEKYGTYASYNKEENFNELKGLVTPFLFNQLEQQAQNVKEGLKSIKTITASVKVTNIKKEEIVCETEIRQEIEKQEESEIVYKKATITFKKLANEWRVNDIKIK